MKWYDQVFTLEVNKSKSEVIQALSSTGANIKENQQGVLLGRYPAWYRVFEGRGTIRLIMPQQEERQINMQCVISPSIVHLHTLLIFFLLNIIVWSILWHFFPLNPLLLILFLIEWLMMAFIAIPVLLLSVFTGCIYMLSQGFTFQTLFFVFISVALSFLLVHAALRYNRGELRKYIIKAVT